MPFESGRAESRDNDIPMLVAPAPKLPRVLDESQAQGVTLAIIDSPCGDGAAAEAADLAARETRALWSGPRSRLRKPARSGKVAA